MPKRTKPVTAPEWCDRDAGKIYLLVEQPAAVFEKWGWRMFCALKGTSAHIPPGVAELGGVGVAIIGLNAFLAADVKYTDLEPLLDEMMTWVQRVRDPKFPDVASGLIDDDTEEFKTRAWLRSEVLGLHVNFGVTEALWSLVTLVTTKLPDFQTT